MFSMYLCIILSCKLIKAQSFDERFYLKLTNCIKGDQRFFKSESDIWPSMVTAVCKQRNLEHTPGAVGSHLCCGARGAFGGLLPCSRGLRHTIEGGESAVHSLPPMIIPAGPRLKLATYRLRVQLSNH